MLRKLKVLITRQGLNMGGEGGIIHPASLLAVTRIMGVDPSDLEKGRRKAYHKILFLKKKKLLASISLELKKLIDFGPFTHI